MDLVFDMNELTIGDIEDLEEIVGMPYEKFDWDKPSMKLMKAMVFISERRRNPSFTVEDARNVKIAEIQVAEANPTTEGEAAS